MIWDRALYIEVVIFHKNKSLNCSFFAIHYNRSCIDFSRSLWMIITSHLQRSVITIHNDLKSVHYLLHNHPSFINDHPSSINQHSQSIIQHHHNHPSVVIWVIMRVISSWRTSYPLPKAQRATLAAARGEMSFTNWQPLSPDYGK